MLNAFFDRCMYSVPIIFHIQYGSIIQIMIYGAVITAKIRIEQIKILSTMLAFCLHRIASLTFGISRNVVWYCIFDIQFYSSSWSPNSFLRIFFFGISFWGLQTCFYSRQELTTSYTKSTSYFEMGFEQNFLCLIHTSIMLTLWHHKSC